MGKGEEGRHKAIEFEGDITQSSHEKKRKHGMANLNFFPVAADPATCVLTFIKSPFIYKIAYWKTEKFKKRNIHVTVNIADVISMFCMWFIMGLFKLPNTLSYFKLGLHNVLRILKIEERDQDNLLKQ